MKIVNVLNPFPANIKQEKTFAFLAFSGDGNISQNGLKGFDRAKHIGLPHKHKSYE